MKLGPKAAWFAAYAALFAVCAAFVFWGTWSTGVSPVMPDCPISHPEGWWANVSAFLREWLKTGLFSPDDVKAFAGAPYFLQELQYAVPAFLAGLAIGLSALFQGRAGAAACDAQAETNQGFTNYLAALGIVETVAIFAMVFALIALGKIG